MITFFEPVARLEFGDCSEFVNCDQGTAFNQLIIISHLHVGFLTNLLVNDVLYLFDLPSTRAYFNVQLIKPCEVINRKCAVVRCTVLGYILGGRGNNALHHPPWS